MKEIQKKIKTINLNFILKIIKIGFISYSNKHFHAAPVIHLGASNTQKNNALCMIGKGDVCLKSGYSLQGDYYIVKVASGGFKNSPNSGIMLLFSQITGQLISILADNGALTDHRTAALGTLSVKEIGPKKIKCIGIIGTGFQARYQLQYLKSVTNCREFIIWGRNEFKLKALKEDFKYLNLNLKITKNIKVLTRNCNVIITTTNATKVLVPVQLIHYGTHLVCIGTDSSNKKEIDPLIFAQPECSLIVADSIKQCMKFGELQHCISFGIINRSKIEQLGKFYSKVYQSYERKKYEITIFDSTGVSIQDYAITRFVYESLNMIS